MASSAADHLRRVTADSQLPRAPVVDERVVRAAAGITMALGAVAFSLAYFDKVYVPLQVAASLFFIEFLIRVTIGIRHSPVGLVARAMTLGQPPEWVPATPKRFAWTLGLVMAGAMTAITNVGIRGYLPRTICLICLTLMWMESALGLCLGCQIYAALVRRGWLRASTAFCPDGSCAPAIPDHATYGIATADATADGAAVTPHSTDSPRTFRDHHT